MHYWKGFLYLVLICLTQILFTYLSMNLIPKLIQSKKNVEFYRAAVYEAVPLFNDSLSVSEVVFENLQNFQKAATLAAINEVNIIVFPENVLFEKINDYQMNRASLIGSYAENVPNPNEGDYNPCAQENLFKDRPVLRNLSCTAKNNNMFLVANVVDYKHCNNSASSYDKNATLNCSDKRECPEDGVYLYNTNVVFNTAGKLVVRYHKRHLRNEPTINPSKCKTNGYFQTDFGAFVTTVGSDVTFKEFEEILQRYDVKNVAYSTHWNDQTPLFAFGGIWHQSFSISNLINALVANAHVPSTGTIGSGIFSGATSALIYTRKPDGVSKLLMSNLPKNPDRQTQNMDDLNRKKFILNDNNEFTQVFLEEEFTFPDECVVKKTAPAKDLSKDYRCYSNDPSDFVYTKLLSFKDTVKTCDESFCCLLTYEAYSMEEDYFLFASASAFQSETYNYKIRSCFVTRCKTKNSESCSNFALISNTVFKMAELKGEFINKYVYPFAVDSNIRLTAKDHWTFDGNSQILYKNSDNNVSLLFLGLYGTDFESNSEISYFNNHVVI